MDQSPNRFTVDQTWQEARSSPEQRRAGTVGLGSSLGALKNGEGDSAVVTKALPAGGASEMGRR
jgi:hypothetical protein